MDDKTILRALRPAMSRVYDPVSGQSVWLAGMVRGPRIEGGALRFDLAVTPAHTPAQRQALVDALVGNLRAEGVDVAVTPRVVEEVPDAPPSPAPVRGMDGPGTRPRGGDDAIALDGVRHVVAVASGKGGVGKSTVAANLAVGLARLGYAAGLLDADVHGPSAPVMLGAHGRPMVADGRIVPPVAHGVRVLSMGMVVDPGQPMIWRGPMVMGAIRQLFADAVWAPLDVLVVDLPPGTGDAQLSLVQSVALSGAVVVTTPQDVALADAVRGIQMFRKLDVPLLGLVENMAWYELPDGSRDPVFGEGGGARTAAAYDTGLLAQLPLLSALRASGDAGVPAVLGDDALAATLLDLARAVAARLAL
ncbi:MAG: Mrp/NBP35 family ATP-binding protein [Alphaproteobacteria bacterium]|nr:Mrp/NBP35 family ATP-binding protein [Alphaproteobacteria bacterium]